MTARRQGLKEAKSERMEMRVSASAKQVIQRATAVSGLSVADLAYDAALRLLNQHERIELAEADRKVFLDALLAPPELSLRLAAAMARRSAEVKNSARAR
jgi:uncharacterized protein (DUF1778 family)